MIYTITKIDGDKSYIFETVYADAAAKLAESGCTVYADGVKVDFPDLMNFAASLHSDYPETMSETDAEYNIACWIADGVELPEGITAGLLAAVFNTI